MSAQARRERAYRHYVSKQMRARQKQMARAQKAANRDMKKRMKQVQPSEPQMTTNIEDVPPPSFSQHSAATIEPVAPPVDAVVAPVTVSGSQQILAQEPEQPSRP